MNTVCRRAVDADRTALKTLWSLSFPEDTEQDIDRFLDTFLPADYAYVLCRDEIVCSMLFLLPVTVAHPQALLKAGYIYAAATHPALRGSGCYRQLMDYVHASARAEALDALFLRPATQELAHTYRRMGFCRPLYNAQHTLTASDVVETERMTVADYYVCRRRLLSGCGQAFVDWDEHTMQYASAWCEARRSPDGRMIWLSRDSGMVWESIPAEAEDLHEAALLKPLSDCSLLTDLILFGYGLM